jgi:hypothetical protein
MAIDRFEPQYTEEEKNNIETYGVSHPRFLETEYELDEGHCCCGKFNCPEEYVHWSKGY